MFTSEDDEIIKERFDVLLAACDAHNIYKYDGDRERIVAAFKFANEAHYGVRRKSGEPYIVHPIAVALISVDEIGLGVKSVIASLLHDVVEDTDYTVSDIERLFGEKVAQMVDGLTKMKAASKITGGKGSEISAQAENFKKMLLTLSSDVRVIIIKLADRLHNMRTLGSMAPKKQMKILGETMYLFAPLAHRLGLYKIKSELEDLSLKYNFPDDYKRINDKLTETQAQREEYIEKLKAPIVEKLVESGIKHEITGRVKSIYSIWKKMQRKQISFDEVFDLFAIRIVFTPVEFVPEKTQCWHIYSLVTETYKPRPERLREWINIPKANGYEALHCTVMGPEGRWAEVQIRSQRMDDIAEKGFAAHWKYKESIKGEGELDKWVKEVRDALNSPFSDAVEFLDEFQFNLYSSEVVIFTPKGDTKILPQGATALDFAYDIHSNVGNHAIGAKINHKIESLYKVLESGDQVEIITANSGRPVAEWLEKASTAKARNHIKSYLKKVNENNSAKGVKIFEEELSKIGVKPSGGIFNKLLPVYNCTNKEEFYSKVGAGIINLDNLKNILNTSAANKIVKFWSIKVSKFIGGVADGVAGVGKQNQQEQTQYKIAECCFPAPGDKVIGFKNSDGVVIVHKRSCEEAIKLAGQDTSSIVETQWSSEKIMSYLSHISIEGSDRMGMLLDISLLLSKQMNINIRKIHVESHNNHFTGYISLYIKDDYDLTTIITRLKALKGVEKVKKIAAEDITY
ncbi:MAG: RelA/SpoT family protein [Rikenellaceae bacterium]